MLIPRVMQKMSPWGHNQINQLGVGGKSSLKLWGCGSWERASSRLAASPRWDWLPAASQLAVGRAAHVPGMPRGQGKQEAVPCHQRDGSGSDRLSVVIRSEVDAYGD